MRRELPIIITFIGLFCFKDALANRGCYIAFDVAVGHVDDSHFDIAGETTREIFDLSRGDKYSVRSFRHHTDNILIVQIEAAGSGSEAYKSMAALLNRFDQSQTVVGNGAAGTYERRERTITYAPDRSWRQWSLYGTDRPFSREAMIDLFEFMENPWTMQFTHQEILGKVRVVFVLTSHEIGWEFFKALENQGYQESPH